LADGIGNVNLLSVDMTFDIPVRIKTGASSGNQNGDWN